MQVVADQVAHLGQRVEGNVHLAEEGLVGLGEVAGQARFEVGARDLLHRGDLQAGFGRGEAALAGRRQVARLDHLVGFGDGGGQVAELLEHAVEQGVEQAALAQVGQGRQDVFVEGVEQGVLLARERLPHRRLIRVAVEGGGEGIPAAGARRLRRLHVRAYFVLDGCRDAHHRLVHDAAHVVGQYHHVEVLGEAGGGALRVGVPAVERLLEGLPGVLAFLVDEREAPLAGRQFEGAVGT